MKTIQFTGTEIEITNLNFALDISDNILPKQTETRVYLLTVEDSDISEENMSDGEFMKLAEEKGSVYSLEGFQQAFNWEEVNSSTDVIRFINVTI